MTVDLILVKVLNEEGEGEGQEWVLIELWQLLLELTDFVLETIPLRLTSSIGLRNTFISYAFLE